MIRSLVADLQQDAGTVCPWVVCAGSMEKDSLIFLQRSPYGGQQGGQGHDGEQEVYKEGRKHQSLVLLCYQDPDTW